MEPTPELTAETRASSAAQARPQAEQSGQERSVTKRPGGDRVGHQAGAEARSAERSDAKQSGTGSSAKDGHAGTVRQRATIQEGIPQDKAKEVVKFIKDSKTKVQAAIQGDVVRVTGRDRDTLQDIIAKLKEKDFGIHMQFTNYRSN